MATRQYRVTLIARNATRLKPSYHPSYEAALRKAKAELRARYDYDFGLRAEIDRRISGKRWEAMWGEHDVVSGDTLRRKDALARENA